MKNPPGRIRVTDLEFKNERTPYSADFEDVYFSPESGVNESTYVYLEGSGAIESIRSGRPDLTISEIGFGAGLNFLLTLREFRSSRHGGTLRYFSFENRPIRKASLERLYAQYPDLREEVDMLLSEYPILTPGIHLLRLLGGRVSLYLCLGDAVELLSRLDFKADHWYWDGFAPSRNPEAFSRTLFSEVAAHSKPLSRGSSFTSAGWVRRLLSEQGFEVKKRPGFGHKRECIEAVFGTEARLVERAPWFSTETQKPLRPGMKTAVIGAGLAGSAMARALAERGVEVTVIDPNGIAGRASGNPIGLFNVQVSKTPNPTSRFAQLSLVSLIRELSRLGVKTNRGILRTDLRDPAPLLNSDYPEDFFELRAEGVFFPECGMLDPRELCALRMDHPRIRFLRDSLVKVCRNDSFLSLNLTEGRNLEFDHVVYCIGADAKIKGASDFHDELHDLNPTRPIRGQIIFTDPTPASKSLRHALVEEGYATPLMEGEGHGIGATYQAKNILPGQEEIDTRVLVESAKKWPEFAGLTPDHVRTIRVGHRLSTPDKLPMIGPLCDPHWMKIRYERSLRGAKLLNPPPLQSPPGEWLLTGLGSRGITYSSLAAEILAEWMSGNPVPIERDLIDHLHSARFFVRKLRKAGVE